MRSAARLIPLIVLLFLTACGRETAAPPSAAAPKPAQSKEPCDRTSAVAARPLEAQPDRSQPVVEPPGGSAASLAFAGYVLKTAALWDPRSAITVCFIGADAQVRGRIRTAAEEWTRPGRANVAFDFGSAPGLRSCTANDSSEIRIGFREAGYKSYVGSEARLWAKPGKPTMNLQDFDKAPPADPHFSAVVLHEFGHALGFEHEHQNPTGGCDGEFDWPKLYAELCKYPNRWSKEMVDANLRQLPDSSAYRRSAADRESIMHYSFEPWMFVKGAASPCHIPERVALSAGDIAGARDAYPANESAEVAARIQLFERSLSLAKAVPDADGRLAVDRAMADLKDQ